MPCFSTDMDDRDVSAKWLNIEVAAVIELLFYGKRVGSWNVDFVDGNYQRDVLRLRNIDHLLRLLAGWKLRV